MRLLCYVMLVAILVAGCAKPKAVRVPPAPPASSAPHPVKKELPPPPLEPPPPPKDVPAPAPMLSPQVSRVEEDRLKQNARESINGAERIVKRIDRMTLSKDDQETYVTIQSFLSKAKEALSTNDFLRAVNLADKAQVLANEMIRRTM